MTVYLSFTYLKCFKMQLVWPFWQVTKPNVVLASNFFFALACLLPPCLSVCTAHLRFYQWLYFWLHNNQMNLNQVTFLFACSAFFCIFLLESLIKITLQITLFRSPSPLTPVQCLRATICMSSQFTTSGCTQINQHK